MANITVKHLPHVKVMAKKYAQNKEYILARLEMSAEAYHVLQFNTAIAWIRSRVWNDEGVISILTTTSDFWNWFINQWNVRDDAFFNTHFDVFVALDYDTQLLRDAWFNAHRVGEIRGTLPDSLIRTLFKQAV